MNKINIFFFLLVIAEVATCEAIAVKNAKVNPVTAIAASKLKAKPILFFNVDRLSAFTDFETGILQSSKSDEMNDIEKPRYQAYQEFQLKIQEICDRAKGADSYGQRKQLTDEYNAESYAKYNQPQEEVRKKIAIIAASISTRLGACVVLNYNTNSLIETSSLMIDCIDPAYDITQEVYDTLNKEYKDSKAQRSTCNQSCCIHCPHRTSKGILM